MIQYRPIFIELFADLVKSITPSKIVLNSPMLIVAFSPRIIAPGQIITLS